MHWNRDEFMKLPSRAVGHCALVILSSSLLSRPCRADEYLLVNGQESEDVVKFNLTTGTSTLYGEYQAARLRETWRWIRPGIFIPRSMAAI